MNYRVEDNFVDPQPHQAVNVYIDLATGQAGGADLLIQLLGAGLVAIPLWTEKDDPLLFRCVRWQRYIPPSPKNKTFSAYITLIREELPQLPKVVGLVQLDADACLLAALTQAHQTARQVKALQTSNQITPDTRLTFDQGQIESLKATAGTLDKLLHEAANERRKIISERSVIIQAHDALAAVVTQRAGELALVGDRVDEMVRNDPRTKIDELRLEVGKLASTDRNLNERLVKLAARLAGAIEEIKGMLANHAKNHTPDVDSKK